MLVTACKQHGRKIQGRGQLSHSYFLRVGSCYTASQARSSSSFASLARLACKLARRPVCARAMKLFYILAAAPGLLACGSSMEMAQNAKESVEDAKDAVGQAIDDARSWTIDGEHIAQRKRHCAREGGTWVERVDIQPCRDGYTTVQLSGWDQPQKQACASGDGGVYDGQCVHTNAANEIYFNDGPSQPAWIQGLTAPMDVNWDVGKWASLFWPSAINHDYCYHHNGTTRHYSHQDCDEQMLADLSAICAEDRFKAIDWFDVQTCKTQAAITFASVRAFGDDAWSLMDTQVDYPQWQPLWKKFGLPHDVMDTDLLEQVQTYRDKLDAIKSSLGG